MNDLYETRISTTRWLAYDLAGNAGWITWVVCTILCIKQGLTLFSILTILPALLMLIGVCKLISERIAKLDRILPKKRLFCGFGALTLGGIAGIPVSVIGLTVRSNGRLPLWMLVGAVLCAGFAGLCFKGYLRREAQSNQHF